VFTEPAESLEHKNDQAALPNLNAEWVNAKGAFSDMVLSCSITDSLFQQARGLFTPS
jgi:hypothetical protein